MHQKRGELVQKQHLTLIEAENQHFRKFLLLLVPQPFGNDGQSIFSMVAIQTPRISLLGRSDLSTFLKHLWRVKAILWYIELAEILKNSTTIFKSHIGFLNFQN
ncbi:MAG: hypothetical protein IPH28_14050 [Cytophagaceae bacterium]|nr:hypothetical protein [Cytophagaceae bacterium]